MLRLRRRRRPQSFPMKEETRLAYEFVISSCAMCRAVYTHVQLRNIMETTRHSGEIPKHEMEVHEEKKYKEAKKNILYS